MAVYVGVVDNDDDDDNDNNNNNGMESSSTHREKLQQIGQI